MEVAGEPAETVIEDVTGVKADELADLPELAITRVKSWTTRTRMTRMLLQKYLLSAERVRESELECYLLRG